MKDGILLTGATGALGSMILQRLCREGYEVVCLVRASDRAEAGRRIQAIVGDRDNVKVVRGDITEPRCGIGDVDRELLAARIGHVLHCAASVNLQDKTATHVTNIGGTRHMLELTESLDVPHVLHVSTAYVIGDAPYLPEQSAAIGQRLRNPYEESKFVGESLVHAWALAREERRFTIFRPSILVGSQDGTTSTFDGHYRYLEPLHRAAESLRKRKGNGLPSDVRVGDDDIVHIPLALVIADKRINYVPIDWVADMIVAAIDAPAPNKTYNLVHHEPVNLREVWSWSHRVLKMNGIAVCDTQQEKAVAVSAQTPLVRRIQRRIDAVLDAYEPYTTTEPHFQVEAARRDLGDRFRPPPPVDRTFLERTLRYALQNNWGTSRQKPSSE